MFTKKAVEYDTEKIEIQMKNFAEKSHSIYKIK